MKEFSYQGIKWSCSELERGWWLAETSTHRVAESSWDKLVEAIKASDPSNPRIDAVAFAELLPGIGSTVGLK